MGTPCIANVIVPASRLRYLKGEEYERRRCSEQEKGWRTKNREEDVVRVCIWSPLTLRC